MDVASPPDGLDPEQAAQFEQIRRRFVSGLARRQTEIDEAPDPAALHAALHRLAGVAGGFGYDSLGELARQAMQALRADDPSALDACLARLKADIRRLLA